MGRGGGGGGGSFGGGGGFRGGGGSFGGNRGGGGRSSWGGRGGGSFGGSGGNRGGSSWGGGGSWGRPFGTGPIFINTGGRRYSNRGPNRSPGGGGCAPGCGTMAIIMAVLAFIFFFLFNAGSGGSSVAPSTREREPLPTGSVNETAYFTDDAGWITNDAQLIDGLRHFYEETGVQPHLYITDEINGSQTASMDQVETFSNAKYDELFTDEGHLLFVFYEGIPNQYITYYVTGTQAKQVIDAEAGTILLDFIDRNYYDNNLTDEQFFSNSFKDAADRIMEVTTSPWIPVLIILGITGLAGILFIWWRKRKEQEAIEAKRTEDLLKTPIETFGKDSEADELAKKYEDKEK